MLSKTQTFTSSFNPSSSFNTLHDPKVRLFNRKENITPRDDILWRIETGVIRTLTWAEDGTFITLGYWGSGDVVGVPLTTLTPYEMECVTNVEVSMLNRDVWGDYSQALISHNQQLERLLSIVHRKPISIRLKQFLDLLGEKFGRDVEGGRAILINVTHQEFAEALNTTRVTVTRLLQQFEEEKIITRYRKKITICG
ncbi:MAG: Crp/Fnr family transcriptional regulator [Cyanobacteria bacterium P01_A01_bin.80]